MIQAWLVMIAVAGLCGCSSVLTMSASTTDVTCRRAGLSQDQINNIRVLIENTQNAGATEVAILSDADTACNICLDPEVDCDATLCVSCFEAIVNDVFSE